MATVGAAVGLPLDLAAVGAIAIGVDEATSAATGRAAGWATVPAELVGAGLRDGLGCVVRDGVGVGVTDGVDDGAAEGVAEGATDGDVDGVGAVVVGAGVGVADVVGAVVESVGAGLADVAAEEEVIEPVEGGCPPDAGVIPGAGAVAAAATPVPDKQITAATAPTVTAPRMTRARGLAPRARKSLPELAPSALPAPADICPPCLGYRTYGTTEH